MRSFAEARGYSVVDRCRNAEGAGAIYDVKELSLDFAFVTRLEVFLERCGAVWVKAVHHGKVMLDKIAAEIDSEFFADSLAFASKPYEQVAFLSRMLYRSHRNVEVCTCKSHRGDVRPFYEGVAVYVIAQRDLYAGGGEVAVYAVECACSDCPAAGNTVDKVEDIAHLGYLSYA